MRQGAGRVACRRAAWIVAIHTAGAGHLPANRSRHAFGGRVGHLAGHAARHRFHLGHANIAANAVRHLLVADLLFKPHLANRDAFRAAFLHEGAGSYRNLLGDAFGHPVAAAYRDPFVADRPLESHPANGNRLLDHAPLETALGDRNRLRPAFLDEAATRDRNLLGNASRHAAGDRAGNRLVADLVDVPRDANFTLFDARAPDLLIDRPAGTLDCVRATAITHHRNVLAGHGTAGNAGIGDAARDDPSGAIHRDLFPLAGTDVDELRLGHGPTDGVADLFFNRLANTIPFGPTDRLHVRLADRAANGVVDRLMASLEDRLADRNANGLVGGFADRLADRHANVLVVRRPDRPADVAGDFFIAGFEDWATDGVIDRLVTGVKHRPAAGVGDIFVTGFDNRLIAGDRHLFADGVVNGFAAGDLARFVHDLLHGAETGRIARGGGITSARRAGRGRTTIIRARAAEARRGLAGGGADARPDEEGDPEDGFHGFTSKKRGSVQPEWAGIRAGHTLFPRPPILRD